MHAIARRIAAKFVTLRGRRLRRRHPEEEEDDPESTAYIPNLWGRPTSQLVPYDGPIISLTPTNDEDDEDENTNGGSSDDDDAGDLGLLYSLAKAWAWPALAHRCETHPWEASPKIVNAEGDTALHWAVFGNPPLYAIEALLRACPDMVNVANAAKQLPLHLACCYRASFEILRALIEINPSTLAVRNGLGFYPLHILCDCGCRPECLEVVLQYQEALRTITEQDYTYGRSPLYILNQRKNLATFGGQVEELRRLRQHQRDAVSCGNWTGNDQTSLCAKLKEAKEMDFWRNARILILAEYRLKRQRSADTKEPTIVQACLGIDHCPPTLLEYAILAYSEELIVADKQGSLPLHHACALCVEQKEIQWLVLEILNANPQAARVPDKHKRLPLEIFLSKSENTTMWSDALRKLILAHPVALDNLQIDSHVYPLVLWRMGCGKDTASQIFELIRASPGLFSHFMDRALQ